MSDHFDNFIKQEVEEKKNGKLLISFPMTVRESYLLGLMINACQKHSNNCKCVPCKVENWALINLQNIGSDYLANALFEELEKQDEE